MKEMPPTENTGTAWHIDIRFLTTAFVVALAGFLVYLPSLWGGFVWDDELYITENPFIRSLGPAFFSRAFTDFIAGNWHPLTMVSLGAEYALWGLNPIGYHLTNTVLHTTNTLLVFFLTARLVNTGRARSGSDHLSYSTETLIAAAITAVLFGTHPIHVESVAWISERKDVLCAFFFLLSIWFYLNYASTSRRPLYYALTLLAFTLALLSKAMAVTLPVVLLTLDWFPLGRFTQGKRVRALIEKLPFFALSIAASVIAVYAQRDAGALSGLSPLLLGEHILVTARSYVFYLLKTALPLELAPLYPYPLDISLFSIESAGSVAVIGVVTTACILLVKKNKAPAALWLYYLVTLLPVIGLVRVGLQASADRYMYLPSVGLFILVGAGAARLYSRLRTNLSKTILITFLALITGLLSLKTITQSRVWKDNLTLWTHEVALYPGRLAEAHNNLGLAMARAGLPDKAIEEYRIAINIKPGRAFSYNNLGAVLLTIGEGNGEGDEDNIDEDKIKEAIGLFRTATTLKRDYAEPHNNLGIAYFKLGSSTEAIAHYRRSLEIRPDQATTHKMLATLYLKQGERDLAEAEFKEAFELAPHDAEVLYNLGTIYHQRGDTEGAITLYKEAVRIDPRHFKAHSNLGVAFAEKGAYDSATTELSKALRLSPDAEAHYNLALVYEMMGLGGLATEEFKRALEINPDFEPAKESLKKEGG